MNELQAASKADAILLKLIESQSEIISKTMFNQAPDAEAVAEAVAAFRRRLIVRLMEQGA